MKRKRLATIRLSYKEMDILTQLVIEGAPEFMDLQPEGDIDTADEVEQLITKLLRVFRETFPSKAERGPLQE